MIRSFRIASVVSFLLAATPLFAQTHPLAPSLSSRPGAPYTLYLDFSGFNFPGNWNNVTGDTPGNIPAYNGQAGATFTAAEQANIKNIWTRISEGYIGFNVNVTTVDPAVAAGQNANDTQRLQYYDNTIGLMHTIIGNGVGNFFTNAGGVSYVDVLSAAQSGSNGLHTNFAFVNRLGGVGAFHNIATASEHEIGHALSLLHQADFNGSTRVNGYSTNNGSSLIAPTMGVSYSAARGAWRQGQADNNGTPFLQNDPLVIFQNNPLINSFTNDGIGHTTGTATPLPLLTGNQINFNTAKGVIVPASSAAPNPIGVNNYTLDYFTFSVTQNATLIVNLIAGRQEITPGVADGDPRLDGTLQILNSLGNVIATANTASLSETLSLSITPGTYFIEISSAGGKQGITNIGSTPITGSQFYDMGSYFLTGVIAVPEPATIALCGVAIVGLFLWHRYRKHTLRTAMERTIP